MFMEIEILRKGATYHCECSTCGATLYTHEWAHWDHNERRDAMEAGTLRCDYCHGHADPETFTEMRKPQYACCYSAPGYLDCTEWAFGPNRRRLVREVREVYGDLT